MALTYPLVNDDCPKPRFSRNRGSLRIANALNSNSTDWQNVQSVIGGRGGGGGEDRAKRWVARPCRVNEANVC